MGSLRGGLLVVVFDGDGFQVFGLEDLTAVEALDVVDAVATGDHGCSLVLAGWGH